MLEKEREACTGQVRLDRDIGFDTGQGRDQVHDEKDRHQHPHRHGNDDEQHLSLRVIQREKHPDGHDAAGGPDRDARTVREPGKKEPDQDAEDPGTQIKGEKVPATVKRLHLARDDPEKPHVHGQVHDAAVDERGGQQLPELVVAEGLFDGRGEPGADEFASRSKLGEILEQKDGDVDDDQGVADRRTHRSTRRTLAFRHDSIRGRRCPYRSGSGGSRSINRTRSTRTTGASALPPVFIIGLAVIPVNGWRLAWAGCARTADSAGLRSEPPTRAAIHRGVFADF